MWLAAHITYYGDHNSCGWQHILLITAMITHVVGSDILVITAMITHVVGSDMLVITAMITYVAGSTYKLLRR